MRCWTARSTWRSLLGVALTAGCVVALMAVTGCGKGKRGTPEQAVDTYFAAVKEGDPNSMLECFAPDVREMLAEMIKGAGKEEALARLGAVRKLEKFKVVDTKIEGDWANVEVSFTVDGKEETETLSLHKIEGKWLVDMPDEAKEGMKVAVEMMKSPDKMKKMMELMEKRTPRGER